MQPYEGGRTEKDFVDYLNEKCGTHRAVGGGLNDEVWKTSCVLLSVLMDVSGWPSRQVRRIGTRVLYRCPY